VFTTWQIPYREGKRLILSDHFFFRIHNSHLINLAFIKRHNKGKGGSVILSDGPEIEVSYRSKMIFLKA